MMQIRFGGIIFGLMSILSSLSASALPPSCTVWQVENWDTEVGKMLTAYVCAEADQNVFLSVQCFGPSKVNLRYQPRGTREDRDKYDYTVRFVFDEQETELAMIYEEMDGALAAYFEIDDAYFDVMCRSQTLEIKPISGLEGSVFSLEGSYDAIGTVLNACRPG